MSKFEKCFEKFLWQSRFIVLLSVVFSLISAAAVFVVGSIDLYLIGVVLLIFSFGIYDLFISQIDIGRSDSEVRVLEIKKLDDLKNRII